MRTYPVGDYCDITIRECADNKHIFFKKTDGKKENFLAAVGTLENAVGKCFKDKDRSVGLVWSNLDHANF